MKILIAQPKMEERIEQLTREAAAHQEVGLFLYPEGYLQEDLELPCSLARTYRKMIISGYKQPKDRAVVIAQDGSVLLDRGKYEEPKIVTISGMKVGFLLCDEMVLQGLDTDAPDIDLIVHPIGVGMFSEEQFAEWIGLAKALAIQHKTVVVGTSHADGSYRNCGISIPIAYGINPDGKEIFIMKNDTRSVILDIDSLQYEIAPFVHR